MKISEVRNIIDRYSQDQLKVIVAQLYKALRGKFVRIPQKLLKRPSKKEMISKGY